MVQTKSREIWVDNVKVIACVLVVLGHFFQSMTKANILPSNDLYKWFNQSIYYFHVPLFFICSGYLYQKLSKVDSMHSWGRNVLKKLMSLGIPYVIFSFATWLLKTVFASSTNDEIGGLIDTLLFHPASPYWYLYALFLLFFITPTFRNSKMAVMGFIAAFLFRVIGIIVECEVPAVSYILTNEIWFVIGMCICVWKTELHIWKSKIVIPVTTGVFFVLLSILICKTGIQNGMIDLLMGLIACYSVITLVAIICKNGKQLKVFGYLAKYTMPIFLMHTLFAAPLRIVLFKIGLQNPILHVILGLTISFSGPIAAAIIMEKSKWLEFILYPGKFCRLSRG